MLTYNVQIRAIASNGEDKMELDWDGTRAGLDAVVHALTTWADLVEREHPAEPGDKEEP